MPKTTESSPYNPLFHIFRFDRLKKNRQEKKNNDHFEILEDASLRSAILNRGERLCEIIHSNPIQKLVFLGDGGVPLVALFEEQWHQLYPGQENPDINIINIGREKWTPLRNHYRERSSEIRVNQSQALSMIPDPESIREIYGKESLEALTKIWITHEPQSILVVDDLRGSGQTEMLVRRISEILNPNCQTSFFYFFTNGEQKIEEDTVDIDTINPLLNRANTPWEERYPLLEDSRPLTEDAIEFTTSFKTDAQKDIIMQTCSEMRSAVTDSPLISETDETIREYLYG